MDMSKTLSDLPMDLHRLILSHDEEKLELKKENEKLKTRVKMLQSLLDEARQDSDSDDDDSEIKAQKYEEEYGEPWPDEEDKEFYHVECDECGAYRNTDLDDFAGFCVFKGRVRAYYRQDCWEVHADTCRNPECPYARCGHCQVCMSYCEELEEKWLEIESECDAEGRTMNRTLLEKFPMCCECERRICKGCRVKDDLICQACHCEEPKP